MPERLRNLAEGLIQTGPDVIVTQSTSLGEGFQGTHQHYSDRHRTRLRSGRHRAYQQPCEARRQRYRFDPDLPGTELQTSADHEGGAAETLTSGGALGFHGSPCPTPCLRTDGPPDS